MLVYGAGRSEGAGRVTEPRNMYSRGQKDNPLREVVKGESRRCAASGRQQSWTRYGKWTGHHRGLRAGHVSTGATRELGRADCLLADVAEDEGYCQRPKPWRWVVAPACQRAGNGTQT